MCSTIPTDFDRARQELLAEFRRLVATHPELARQELDTTLDAMRQLVVMASA